MPNSSPFSSLAACTLLLLPACAGQRPAAVAPAQATTVHTEVQAAAPTPTPAVSVPRDAALALLRRYAGEWDTVVVWQAPNFPKPLEWKGHSSMRLLGENWLISEHRGAFLGNGFESHDVTGFDAQTQRWSSIWTDKMNDAMLRFDGAPSLEEQLAMEAPMVDDQGVASKLRRHVTWTNPDQFQMHFVSTDANSSREIMTISATRAAKP